MLSLLIQTLLGSSSIERTVGNSSDNPSISGLRTTKQPDDSQAVLRQIKFKLLPPNLTEDQKMVVVALLGYENKTAETVFKSVGISKKTIRILRPYRALCDEIALIKNPEHFNEMLLSLRTTGTIPQKFLPKLGKKRFQSYIKGYVRASSSNPSSTVNKKVTSVK